MILDQPPPHLESGEVAAYLDRALAPADRARLEAHLVDCADCRSEMVAVARLLKARHQARRWYGPVGIAAAAAALLLFLWLRPAAPPVGSPEYREPAVTTTISPAVVGPRGVVTVAHEFVWTAVPHADRYRLVLFDDTGRVVWETQTSDTSVLLPDSIELHEAATYLWKVQAQTGWNRWVDSDLVEFSLGAPRP
jgi:Putative zinc-finger